MTNPTEHKQESGPKLSIGVPVYNGERHLGQALESLLAQTYTDFEIIICDNASTDGTENICRDFASRDPRIRYHRNPSNIGAGPNFNMAFEMSSAPFFKWAAHDDVCLPDYLQSCMQAMLEDDSIAVGTTEIELIDDDGNVIRAHSEDLSEAGDTRPSKRFRNLVLADHWCIDVFGVMRRDVLLQTPLIASYVGSDRTLLAELALRGRYYRAPRVLFQNRDHPRRSVHSTDIGSAERAEWFDPSQKRESPAPLLQCWWEFLKAVGRVELPIGERLRCYSAAFSWVIAYRWDVRRELGQIVQYAVHSAKRRARAG